MSEPIILRNPAQMHEWRRKMGTATIGFVPTMGALHDGHRALLLRSNRENEHTVLSIFVNPTQFNVANDFESYPRTLDDDLAVARQSGVHAVFVPDADSMYPEGFASFIEPCRAALPLEGERRPGHFRGVTTIVNKLFNCVDPTRAYFGKKDFQQLAVINGMVRELNMTVQIVGLETVRESDGLAMSSRNRLLDPQDRLSASVIHRAMHRVLVAHEGGERSAATLESMARETLASEPRCNIEYATICDAATFVRREVITTHSVLCLACWFGEVRLIDNVELPA